MQADAYLRLRLEIEGCCCIPSQSFNGEHRQHMPHPQKYMNTYFHAQKPTIIRVLVSERVIYLVARTYILKLWGYQ
jgi:hypothetical protein